MNIFLRQLDLIRISLSQIVWPVAGGLLGFLLFFVLLVYGVSVTTDNFSDKTVELMGVTVATFVAAWAGGWAAFGAERRTQDINRKNSRISAANKAILQLLRLTPFLRILESITLMQMAFAMIPIALC